MVALFSWQQQSSELKVQIFDSLGSAWKNPMFKKNFFDLTNVVLYYILFYNGHLSYFRIYRTFTELWATESHHH